MKCSTWIRGLRNWRILKLVKHMVSRKALFSVVPREGSAKRAQTFATATKDGYINNFGDRNWPAKPQVLVWLHKQGMLLKLLFGTIHLPNLLKKFFFGTLRWLNLLELTIFSSFLAHYVGKIFATWQLSSTTDKNIKVQILTERRRVIWCLAYSANIS